MTRRQITWKELRFYADSLRGYSTMQNTVTNAHIENGQVVVEVRAHMPKKFRPKENTK